MQVELAKFFIAGLQYTPSQTLRLYRGEYLILQKEPDNPNDAYAIAIYKEQHKLGYVPKNINRAIYQKIDTLEVMVEEYFDEAPPWERVLVSIFYEE
ncbi:MAG: HIRAN domain-containing protein [Campylobacterales bacterium]|nr:HIRAN domain-containing protein [Campylobacterales bacterium]